MAEGPIRLGLIGAGRWGRIYIKTLSRLDGFELARLASANPESRQLVGESCIIDTDWRAVAGATDLDGVIIATPPHVHGEMARVAIEGENPVLVEKPLTLDLGEAHSLLEYAINKAAIVHVDHIHLYHPAYRKLKEVGLGLGPIHAVRSGAGDWGPFRNDTPMLWDRGSHEIALCLDLLGEKPTNVSAQIKETRKIEDSTGEAIAVQLTFQSGVKADIDLSNLLEKKKRFFAVHYDHDTLIYDDIGPDALVREPRIDDARCAPEKAETIEVEGLLPLDQVFFDFADAIKKGKADIDGLKLAVDVIDVIDACQKSIS